MADIFVSYARADKSRVSPLVAALAREGWSVWWDPEITPGQEFDRLINQELRAAKAVIVVWTPISVDSRWVRGEARIAAERGVLVPVRFENANLPIDALTLHTTDLDDWNDDAAHAGFQGLVRALRALIAHTGEAGAQSAASTYRAPQAAGASEQSRSAQPAAARRLFGLNARQLIPALAIVLGTAVAITGTIVRHGAPPHHARSGETAPVVQGAPAATSPAPQRLGAPGSAVTTKPRLAVLPFENLSPDPANAFFTDGLHEEIISTLANSAPGLEVISRTTVMMYRAAPKPVETIARELDATNILEGSVRREGDHVRLTLQLIDGATDNHIWSQDYDRTLKDALSLQVDVAREVASQLSIKLLGTSRAAAATTSAEAYDLYLKAQLAYGNIWFGTSLAEIADMQNLVSRALQLDPNFVMAYVLRTRIASWAFVNNNDPSQESVNLWKADVDAAKRLAPNDPNVIAADAGYISSVEEDLPRALAILDRLEQMNLADAGYLITKSDVLKRLGRMDQSIAAARRAVDEDRQNRLLVTNLVAALWAAIEPQEVSKILGSIRDPEAKPLVNLLRFAFAGNIGADAQLLNNRPSQAPIDAEFAARGQFQLLRFQHRYRDLRQLLDATPFTSVRITGFDLSGVLPGAGRMPVADYRGWTDLLLGNAKDAAIQGRAILDFVAATEKTPWNKWSLRILAGDGHLFLGSKKDAIADAESTLTLTPRSHDASIWRYAALGAAQIFAWSGEGDRAAELLEQVAGNKPGIAPAFVALDPLYTVPLANNTRYQMLKAKLEAQMAATKLE